MPNQAVAAKAAGVRVGDLQVIGRLFGPDLTLTPEFYGLYRKFRKVHDAIGQYTQPLPVVLLEVIVVLTCDVEDEFEDEAPAPMAGKAPPPAAKTFNKTPIDPTELDDEEDDETQRGEAPEPTPSSLQRALDADDEQVAAEAEQAAEPAPGPSPAEQKGWLEKLDKGESVMAIVPKQGVQRVKFLGLNQGGKTARVMRGNKAVNVKIGDIEPIDTTPLTKTRDHTHRAI